MRIDTNEFYDAIAEYYPMLYRDWEAQLEREGLGLRAIFRNKGVLRVLDAACGIGTQTIPLCELGYEVVAVDPSPVMLKKMYEKAEARNISDKLTIARARFNELPDVVEGPFDGIVCKGNALPHLLTDEDIETALYIFYELLRPGGVVVIGMRDFEPFMEHRPRFLPGHAHYNEDNNTEFITFDIWEWDDGPPVIATQNLFIIEGESRNYVTIKRSVRFRPLSTDEVKVVLLELGYEDIIEHPDRNEQVLVARKPLSG